MAYLARLQQSRRLTGDAGISTTDIPDWLRAGYRTAIQTFIGVFGLALLGWFADIQKWAGDTEGHFPSVSPLGKALASAVAAAAAGLVAAVVNAVGKRGAVYPPAPPAG